MKITSYQLYHNTVQRVKIKFNFDKKIKPVKALRGVGGEKTVKLPRLLLEYAKSEGVYTKYTVNCETIIRHSV